MSFRAVARFVQLARFEQWFRVMTIFPAPRSPLPATSMGRSDLALIRYNRMCRRSGRSPVALRALATRLRIAAVYASQAGRDGVATALLDRAHECVLASQS